MAYLQAARTAALRRRKAADSGGEKDKRTHHAREFSNNSDDFWMAENADGTQGTQSHRFHTEGGSERELRRSNTTKDHDYDIPKYQWHVKACYSDGRTEVLVAVLIAINFFVSIIKFQTCPLDRNGNLYCYGESEQTNCMDYKCYDTEADSKLGDEDKIIRGVTEQKQCEEDYGGFFNSTDVTEKMQCGWPQKILHAKWDQKNDGRGWTEACQSTVALGTAALVTGLKDNLGICDAGEWHHIERHRYRLAWPKYTVKMWACKEEVALSALTINGQAATAGALTDATDQTPVTVTQGNNPVFAVGVNGNNAILRTGEPLGSDGQAACTDAVNNWYSYELKGIFRHNLRANSNAGVPGSPIWKNLTVQDAAYDQEATSDSTRADVCVCDGGAFSCPSADSCPNMGVLIDAPNLKQNDCVGPKQEVVEDGATLQFPRIFDDESGRVYSACWNIYDDVLDTTIIDQASCTRGKDGLKRVDREWRTWHPSCLDQYTSIAGEDTYHGHAVRHGGLACGARYDCELAGYVWECNQGMLSETQEGPGKKGPFLPITTCSMNGPLVLSPDGSVFFFSAECFFAFVFGIELVINMIAHMGRCCKVIYTKGLDDKQEVVHTLKEDGCVCNSKDWLFREFFCGPNKAWNIFDFVIVIISLMSVALPPGEVPGMGILRLFRAFRVFRLFARLGELKKIITAMERALPGVASASLVLLLVIAIFAILGVNFFGTTNYPVPDHYRAGVTWGWVCSVKGGALSGNRQALLNPEILPEAECVYLNPYEWGTKYFGRFSKSLFTLFQVLTGESWAEAVARPATQNFWPSAIYFIVYVLICGYILINVVIAVLLDKMMTYDPDEGNETQEEKEYVDCLECGGNGYLVGDFAMEDDDGGNKIMCTECRGSGQIDIDTLFTEESIKKDAQVIMNEVKKFVDRSVTQLQALYKIRGIEWREEVDGTYLANDEEEEEPALAGRDPQMSSQDRHLGHDPAPCEGE